MLDDEFGGLMAAIEGDDPLPGFISSLRTRLEAEIADEPLGKASINNLTLIATQPAQGEQPMTKRFWIGGTVAAAAILVVAGLVIANNRNENAGVSDSDPVVAEADPSQTLETLVATYNLDDIDAVMALFSEESVITDHPMTGNREGLTEIRSLQVLDRDAAATVDPWEISNVDVSGFTVTWDHVWTNDAGEDWCAEGNTATIRNGKILTWNFAPNPHLCTDHQDVIAEYVSLYNSADDIDGVMALFSEESVITDHPMAANREGLTEIRSLEISDRDAAAGVDPYVISNVGVSGYTVTWDHVWTNDAGEDWCAEGHTATIRNGKILTWNFAPNPHLCTT